MRERPTLPEVVAAVEKLEGEKWETFRDRHGDWGRDLVPYLGRTTCGLKLKALAEAAGGIDYVSAGATANNNWFNQQQDIRNQPLAEAQAMQN